MVRRLTQIFMMLYDLETASYEVKREFLICVKNPSTGSRK
jgi:hypothetical protein